MIGYTDYDHAGWVRDNARAFRESLERDNGIRAARGLKPRSTKLPTKGWLTVPFPLPDWQRRAMHVLGMTFGGIYNAPISWDAVDWGEGRHLHVPMRRYMATFDGSELTAFVFLCHEASIRGAVAAHTPHLLRISMSPRQRTTGGTFGRHPTLYEALRDFAGKIGENHPVQFGYEPPGEHTE